MMATRKLIAAIFILYALTLPHAFAQGGWSRGQLVGLRAGTCIREGPGLGYRAHTRVPEDNWTVMVIDGPRAADGRIWWDTSRNAAGDPSGGTGWVTEDQADTACGGDYASTAQQPGPGGIADNPAPVPELSPSPPINIFISLRIWWLELPALLKWAVAVIALLMAPALWRFIGGVVTGLIGAALLSLAILVAADLTRPLWEERWLSFAERIFWADTPDLALLLAGLPLAFWLLSLVSYLTRVRRTA